MRESVRRYLEEKKKQGMLTGDETPKASSHRRSVKKYRDSLSQLPEASPLVGLNNYRKLNYEETVRSVFDKMKEEKRQEENRQKQKELELDAIQRTIEKANKILSPAFSPFNFPGPFEPVRFLKSPLFQFSPFRTSPFRIFTG